ncbi:MAG: VCBS repeat-containing protein, partial [Planctomycetota bacterium]
MERCGLMSAAGAAAAVVFSAGAAAEPVGGFTDVTAQMGLTHQNLSDLGFQAFDPELPDAKTWWQDPPYMAGAVAVGDVNGDGWDDLLFTRFQQEPRLYLNNAGAGFVDASVASGLAAFPALNGAAFGDIDNDGDLDLYATGFDTTRYFLFINDGAGVFTEDAQARGAAVEDAYLHRGWGVAMSDIDNDSYLDVITGEWLFFGQGPQATFNDRPTHARLLRNNAGGQPGMFDDVTASAGVGMSESDQTSFQGYFRFHQRFWDMDGDMDQDIYVAGDFATETFYINNGDGTFTEGNCPTSGLCLSINAMGIATGDVNGDLLPDMYVTSIDNEFEQTGIFNWDPHGNRLYI